MQEKGRTRVTLIQSDEESPGGMSLGGQGEMVELWVRTPDSERLEEVSVGARLCSCRSVCLAVIEDSDVNA